MLCVVLVALLRRGGFEVGLFDGRVAGVVAMGLLIGAVVGALRVDANGPNSSTGRTLLLWLGRGALTVGGALACGSLGGYLGLSIGTSVAGGPDFKGSPSPGAGFAAVIVLAGATVIGAGLGLGIGFFVSMLLNLRRGLVWIQVPLAMVGYGVVLLGIFLMSDAMAPVPQPVPVVDTARPIPAKPKPSKEPAPGTAASALDADPAWKPADTFADAVKTYGGLIYPGSRASQVPIMDQNEMFVLASGDSFAQVATYYRARLQVRHDLSDHLVGTAPVTDGKTAFVGVTVRDGLTFVSLTCGKAAPP